MSFDYKTFDPKTLQTLRPLAIVSRKTIINANSVKKLVELTLQKLPKNAERISATITFIAPATREITDITKLTKQITQQPTDPTRTLLAWNEFGNRVSEEISANMLTPPTTREEVENRIRLLFNTLLEMFDNQTWIFMMKGDLFAVTYMNRLSPDYRFSTEYTPADDALLAELMQQTTNYLAEWTQDMQQKAFDAIAKHAGESTQQIGDAVAQAIGSERNRGVLIARTEIMRAFNRKAEQRYDNARLRKIWLTAADATVCETCESLDGRDIEEINLRPPLHPLCRCTIIPVLRNKNA